MAFWLLILEQICRRAICSLEEAGVRGSAPLLYMEHVASCAQSFGDHRDSMRNRPLFPVIGNDQRRRKTEAVKRTVEYRKGEALRICRRKPLDGRRMRR